jgi:inhibitor of KinA sporulation pathway (predicted exonuclease)
MKLTQDLIVLDLEATPSGFSVDREIIQIGAVYLKREGTTYRQVSFFDQLVKPSMKEVTREITDLTDIEPELLKEAQPFSSVGDEFNRWARQNGNIKNVRLGAWGTQFDLPLWRYNCVANGVDYIFPETAIDIKSWAALWIYLNNHSFGNVGLKDVCQLMEINFEGPLHNALADAKHTAKIALKILNNFQTKWEVGHGNNQAEQ